MTSEDRITAVTRVLQPFLGVTGRAAREVARQAIEAAGAEMSRWHPMASVPTDGSFLLANDLGEVCPCQSRHGERIVGNMPGFADWTWGSVATAWMPLPAPPAPEQESPADERDAPPGTWDPNVGWTFRTSPKQEGPARDSVWEEAAKVAEGAKLPLTHLWGPDAMECFDFGKQRAAEAIRALKSPACAGAGVEEALGKAEFELAQAELASEVDSCPEAAMAHVKYARRVLRAALSTGVPVPKNKV